MLKHFIRIFTEAISPEITLFVSGLRSHCLQPNCLHGGNVSGDNLTMYAHMQIASTLKIYNNIIIGIYFYFINFTSKIFIFRCTPTIGTILFFAMFLISGFSFREHFHFFLLIYQYLFCLLS